MRVDLDKYREAGRIASEARKRAASQVLPGVRYVDVLDEIERYIREQGAELAFPAQVSVNFIAAHAKAKVAIWGHFPMPQLFARHWHTFKSCFAFVSVRTASLPIVPARACSTRLNAVLHPALA